MEIESLIPGLTWNHTYSWSTYDVARSGIETDDEGLLIVGYSEIIESNERDFLLVKLDANGNILWTQSYGGKDNDDGVDVIQTTDKGYAMTGYTYSYGAGSADAWLIKTDNYGKVEWKQTYGEENDDKANTLIQTADGGYALAGRTMSYGAGHVDGWLLKIDDKGMLQWSQTYGGPRWDEIEDIIQATDGGYLLVGSLAVGDSASPEELWVMKTDAMGNIQWNYTYGGRGADIAYSVMASLDGGYTIAGQRVVEHEGLKRSDFWLVKIDEQGLMEWNQSYGGISIDISRSVVQTADGGYALLGETDSFGAGSFDYWLVKTDANGSMQWNQTFGSPYIERGYSLVETSDGGLVMIGYTDPYQLDFLVIKVGGKLSTRTWTIPTSSSPAVFLNLPLVLLILLPLTVVKHRKY